jgi:hypothetical protein
MTLIERIVRRAALARCEAQAALDVVAETDTSPQKAAWLRDFAAFAADVASAYDKLLHLATLDHVDVLLELARDGGEAPFKQLASSVGVAADGIDALWTGTRSRLGLRP